VHLLTFGCQMNKHDSELVAGLLRAEGAELADNPAEAGLVILNTCAVRAHAEERVYNRLHLLRQRKKEQPDFLIAVIGCMAQRDGERLARKFPWVDLLIGTRMLDEFPRLLAELRRGARRPLLALEEKPQLDFGLATPQRENKFLAYLAVSRGCNKGCAYCVVPRTRGPERSRPVAELAAEAERLVAGGALEITLLGQTIDTYGRDLADGASLVRLLRTLYEIKGLQRIRFVTSHPAECREELFATMAELGAKVMPFLHIPPQSGSDEILKRMQRGYTRARYLEVVRSARRLCPEIEFCGDWIVGFCGETESDFRQSLELLEEVDFQQSFVFKYSMRPGTPAESWPDDVPDEVKRERHARLSEAQTKISLRKNKERIGLVEEVLAESVSKSDFTRLTGRTRTHRLLHFPGPPALIGKLAQVRVTSATALSLTGMMNAE
jgi:tRNA-2-methylthio-N6-dimethylallyladenosine synthase